MSSRGRPPLIAISGVDGSGKSTLVRGLVSRLQQAGHTPHVLWFRPGMGMGGLDAPARLLKRLMNQAPEPAVRQAATGDVPRTRQGFTGYLWCLLVTTVYLRHMTSGLRRAQDVVVCDRYVVDALVTLRVFYDGVDTRLPQYLVRRLLPPPIAAVYLEAPADVALARKPGDTIGGLAVVAQLAAYGEEVAHHPSIVVLDSTLEPDAILDRVWRMVEPFVGATSD